MEQLFELLKTLYLIRFYSKDIHYNAKGPDFWSDHEFADEIFKDIDDNIDDINECLFLGYEKPAPKSKDILMAVVEGLPPIPTDITQAWKNLYNLIANALNVIENIEAEWDMPALNSRLDTIADDLQKKRGLIWRRKLSI
jgi:DNA-binding ferritin-like protein